MRALAEDILRQIATNRKWARSYGIMLSLAKNADAYGKYNHDYEPPTVTRSRRSYEKSQHIRRRQASRPASAQRSDGRWPGLTSP